MMSSEFNPPSVSYTYNLTYSLDQSKVKLLKRYTLCPEIINFLCSLLKKTIQILLFLAYFSFVNKIRITDMMQLYKE